MNPLHHISGHHFDIFLTSTNPQSSRYYLLNTDANKGVRLAIYYMGTNRLDVYYKGNYIPPKNSELNSDGERVLVAPKTPDQYKPNLASDPGGTNYFDNVNKMQYILLRGSETIEINSEPMVTITFGIPSVTINQFYDGKNIVRNLASFLGIPSNMVRVVNIVRENSGSSGRKKRAAPVTRVVVEISKPPIQNIPTGGSNATQNATSDRINSVRNDMVNISDTIVTTTQLGSLENVLNITLTSVKIVEPLPDSGSKEWQEVARKINESVSTEQEVSIPASMRAIDPSVIGTERSRFNVVPAVHMVDNAVLILTVFGLSYTSVHDL